MSGQELYIRINDLQPAHPVTPARRTTDDAPKGRRKPPPATTRGGDAAAPATPKPAGDDEHNVDEYA